MLIDACSRLGKPQEPPDTGTVQGDLLVLLHQLVDQLQSANWSSVYPSIIDAAERDPQIRSLQAAMHQQFMAPYVVVLERARSRKQLLSQRPIPELIGRIIGPLFFRRWFSKEEFGKRAVEELIEDVIGSTKTRSKKAR